jgi:hypothetical protein
VPKSDWNLIAWNLFAEDIEAELDCQDEKKGESLGISVGDVVSYLAVATTPTHQSPSFLNRLWIRVFEAVTRSQHNHINQNQEDGVADHHETADTREVDEKRVVGGVVAQLIRSRFHDL